MPLPLKSASDLVNDQTNAMQAVAKIVLDFNTGAILRAIVESNAGNSMWLQALISDLLGATRLATCKGIQVDTFVGDYGLTRTAATNATGSVTFSRFTFNTPSTIKVGDLVSSITNGVNYSVSVDSSNPYYSPSLNAYIIPALTQAITVPVFATVAGSIGNCLANQITTISSVIIGVDSVTNEQPLTNGKDSQSDDSLKAAFVLFLASLFRATQQAIEYAVQSVVGVKRYKLEENETTAGNPDPGFFYAVIDDGTGSASPELLTNVQIAVEVYRGLTINFSIVAPIDVPISITATVHTNGTVESVKVIQNVESAIEKYITDKSFDSAFPYSRVPEIIYDADTSIINVTAYTLNGGTTDVSITGREIMTVGTLTITVP